MVQLEVAQMLLPSISPGRRFIRRVKRDAANDEELIAVRAIPILLEPR